MSKSIESFRFLVALIFAVSGFLGGDTRNLAGSFDTRELDLIERLDIVALSGDDYARRLLKKLGRLGNSRTTWGIIRGSPAGSFEEQVLGLAGLRREERLGSGGERDAGVEYTRRR